MRGTFALSASVIAVTWAASALAASHSLKGDYGFTGSAACLVAPGHVGNENVPPPLPNPSPGVALANSGFNANLQPNDFANPGDSPSASFNHSFSVEGVRTFKVDGTGTVTGTAVGVDNRPTPGPNGFPHFPPSASTANFSYSFTYTVSDGEWTSTMVPGSYTETFTSGPRNGQTGTVDAIPPVIGMIALDGKTLTGAHLDAVVETHTYSNGDVWPEICHRSRVFLQLQPNEGH
jgi:hypothetical protein